VPDLEYEFTPEKFDPDEVKRAFMALKHAYIEIIKELSGNIGEKYIETIRKAAKAISEISGWNWYENICYPWDERKIICYYNGRVHVFEHDNYYFHVFFTPQGIKWFNGISWSNRAEVEGKTSEEWKKIEASTCYLFKVPEDEEEEFYDRMEPRLREGQEITRK